MGVGWGNQLEHISETQTRLVDAFSSDLAASSRTALKYTDRSGSVICDWSKRTRD
jgi:hypothetical protein